MSVHNARNSPGDNNDSKLFSEDFLLSYCIIPLLMILLILKTLYTVTLLLCFWIYKGLVQYVYGEYTKAAVGSQLWKSLKD